MSHQYLYILVEATGKSCKIGVSVNPWKRAEALGGTFDYKSSRMVLLPSSSVNAVEKFIHRTLQEHSIKMKHGDGYTEWYEVSAKDKAMNIVNTFASSLLAGEWEEMDRDKFERERAAMRQHPVKTKQVIIRLTPAQEDRVLIHAARHKIKKLTPMVQVLFEEGLALMDGMLQKQEEGRT